MFYCYYFNILNYIIIFYCMHFAKYTFIFHYIYQNFIFNIYGRYLNKTLTINNHIFKGKKHLSTEIESKIFKSNLVPAKNTAGS